MIPNHMTVINQPYDNSLDKLIERREEERFGDIELFYGLVIKTPLYLLGPRQAIEGSVDILNVLTKLYAVH